LTINNILLIFIPSSKPLGRTHMKYFGNKSLSSFMSGLLHVSWYLVLFTAVIAPLVLGGIILFSTSIGDSVVSAIEKGEFHTCDRDFKHPHRDIKNELSKDFTEKDRKDWEEFKNLPLGVKFIILPYCEAVIILLLIIIGKSRQLFTNFRNNVMFNEGNVLLISKISKLLIAFSILTFSFSSLVLSVVLLMVCEIIKSGAALQEEHDYTV
jgi:hypothetical protein